MGSSGQAKRKTHKKKVDAHRLAVGLVVVNRSIVGRRNDFAGHVGLKRTLSL
jgi:hypothetical protein